MSTIAAGTTTNTALVSTGNTDGTLQLQVNGTTPSVTLNTAGAVGVGSSPAYGTSGQVLTSGGSSAAPTWTTPSAGAMTLVSTLTASSSASLSWTGLTSDKYMIVIQRMYTSTGADLFLQFGYGSTTWVTSNYAWVGTYTSATSGGGSGVGNINFGGASGIGFYPLYYMSNAANPANMCVMHFGGLQSGVNQMQTSISQSNYGGSSTYYYTSTSGANNIANAITGIRLIPNSGNIVSGTASLYAITS